MKNTFGQKLLLAALFSIVLLVINSCSSPLKLTSSWTNKKAVVKNSPSIMVMVLGKPNSTARQDFENDMVTRLKKGGFKAVPASDFIKPGVSKRDSAELVNILRNNKIDMLITNAVIDITEKERFIPGAVQGTTTEISTGGYATPYNPYYYVGYNNYYNYYNSYSSYHTIDAPPVKGTTVTDVEVMIESKLYDVATPELIWHGQSRSYSKEPTKKLISTFSKIVIQDIKKNDLLKK